MRTIQLDKLDSSVVYSGNWQQGASSVEVQLEPASNVSGSFGTFGNVNGGGRSLYKTSSILVENTDYKYDNYLDASPYNIYNTANSGALSPRYLRLVENSVNVASAGGLNLRVMCKNLNKPPSELVPPPQTECYIDPKNGRFMLPRPLYWSTMQAIYSITSPSLRWPGYEPTWVWTTSGPLSDHSYSFVDSGKTGFNNCLMVTAGQFSGGSFKIYPFSASHPVMQKGTASFYSRICKRPGAQWACDGDVFFYLNSSTYVQINYHWGTRKVKIVVNGSDKGSVNIDSTFSTTALNHVYINWDGDAEDLPSSRTIEVWINNSLIKTTTSTFTTGTILFDIDADAALWSASNNYFDNLKIWPYCVKVSGGSATASWEYTAGNAGVTYAYHPMYSTRYQPSGFYVGYYYNTALEVPVYTEVPGSNAEVTWEEAYNLQYAEGYFGFKDKMVDDTYTDLEEMVHYQYDKRMDASKTYDDPTDGFDRTDHAPSTLGDGGIYDATENPYGVSLPTNKFLRLADKTYNVKYAGTNGLGLRIFAKELTSSFITPLVDQCFIDPALGKFILPRPNYWCKCESVDELGTPTLRDVETPITLNVGTDKFSISPAKYNNGIYTEDSYTNVGYVYPFGSGINVNEGTMSFWINLDQATNSTAAIIIYLAGVNTYIYLDEDYMDVCVDSLVRISRKSITNLGGSMHHIYLVWDRAGTLSDSTKRFRLWIDNTEVTYTETIPSWTVGDFFFKFHVISNSLLVDNIKIWKHVVSSLAGTEQSGSWEFSNTVEDGMHYRYGATNDYKPQINGVEDEGGLAYKKKGGLQDVAIWTV